MELNADQCYQAMQGRDHRFDGVFTVAVTTTRIYCRPSCPATTPKRHNVRFYRTAAAAQQAGFRACKRCRPDASPGSPEWNARADLVGRAMRSIADGAVDRDGVGGLARRLHVSERHLHRLLVHELGASPIALARAQRAQTARILIETTELPITEIAYASGFQSIRQFNDTVREVFATTPTELRRAAQHHRVTETPGEIIVRLPYRPPFAGDELIQFLATRAVDGVEAVFDADHDGDRGLTYRRTLRLPHAAGIIDLTPADGYVRCRLRLGDLRDLTAAVARARRLLDLDADPMAIDTHLGSDRSLSKVVRATPGRRVPGHVDPFEVAVRAVLGQQVSVAAARRSAIQLVEHVDDRCPIRDELVTHLFPTAAQLIDIDAAALPGPERRRATIRGLASFDGLTLESDRDQLEARLLALPGIGPWTTSYIAMRAFNEPDAFLPTDLGVRQGLERLGLDIGAAERWRPYRSYAVMHLWSLH